jgi:hypothetical protein
MVGKSVEDNLRHFAIETAEIQIGKMIDLTAHETRPETVRPAQIVTRYHAVIDALNGRLVR